MKPLKAKELIPETANDLGLSESLVQDIVTYYYQEVRKSLSSLKHARVHLTNLGDFTIKHWKIDEKIEMLEKFEEKNKQRGLQQMTARFKTAETLFDLRNIKQLVEEEKQRAEFIKIHNRLTNESDK